MPLIDIHTNLKEIPDNLIREFVEEFANAIGKKVNDIELCLSSDAKIQFNGNLKDPAAYILYKTTDQQFELEERRLIVRSLGHLIVKKFAIKPNRIFIQLRQLFENEVGIGSRLFLDIASKSKI